MATNNLTHLSLFTGIGGIDLAAEWAGFETVGQVEKNKFCQRWLTKTHPNCPGWGDIHELTKESFQRRTGLKKPTIISAGPPCQPFSSAGARKGTEDERNLWPEMFEVVESLSPRWIITENVSGLLHIDDGGTIENILTRMEDIGYEKPAVFDFTADPFGLPTMERHVWIVTANADIGREGGAKGRDKNIRYRLLQPPREGKRKPERSNICETRFHSVDQRLTDKLGGGGRAAIRGIANAVVPQQIYPILRGIAEIEGET